MADGKIWKQRFNRPGLRRPNPGCEQPETGRRHKEARAVIPQRGCRRGDEIALPHPHPDHRVGIKTLADVGNS